MSVMKTCRGNIVRLTLGGRRVQEPVVVVGPARALDHFLYGVADENWNAETLGQIPGQHGKAIEAFFDGQTNSFTVEPCGCCTAEIAAQKAAAIRQSRNATMGRTRRSRVTA
jgi:hypothetical protein